MVSGIVRDGNKLRYLVNNEGRRSQCWGSQFNWNSYTSHRRHYHRDSVRNTDELNISTRTPRFIRIRISLEIKSEQLAFYLAFTLHFYLDLDSFTSLSLSFLYFVETIVEHDAHSYSGVCSTKSKYAKHDKIWFIWIRCEILSSWSWSRISLELNNTESARIFLCDKSPVDVAYEATIVATHIHWQKMWH